MNEWKPVVLLARNNLIVLALTLLLALSAVVSMRYVQNDLNTALLQHQAVLQDQQAQLEIKNTDLKNMESHIKRYKSLQERGLVGTPDRAMWVEQLQASRIRLALPDAFSVQLLAAKPLGGADVVEVEEGAPPQPLAHDLEFELQEVHELELLALVQDFRVQARGRFRVQNCMMGVPKDTGLSAKCSLRFVTIPAVDVPNATEVTTP